MMDSERRTIRFQCNEEGLYINKTGHTFKKKDKNDVIIMTNTIEDFTPQQVPRAICAKKLYRDLRAETVDNLKFGSRAILQRMYLWGWTM